MQTPAREGGASFADSLLRLSLPAVGRYEKFRGLTVEPVEPGIVRLVLKAPGKLNAVDAQAHRDLANIWLEFDHDPDVRVVVVIGEGRAFSSGGDLDLVAEMADSFEVRVRVLQEARDLVYNVINCSKMVVAAMRGPAVGAGLAVGLLADVSIASETARIIDGHTKLGVAAGDHSAIVWPLLCGMAKSKYHLLTCEPVTGPEAERIGLVSLCVPDDQLEAKALEVAQRLARGSQTALRFTKLALNNWLRLAGPTFDASLALEFLGFGGPDLKEGIAAVKEKRPASFDRPKPT